MPTQTLTAEEILRTIQKRKPEALYDEKCLLALFMDYSRGQLKAQQNHLDVFLKCKGNTCILNLQNAPKQKQQTEYARLIQKMVDEYGMQRELALEISGAFWRVVCDMPVPVNSLQEVPKPPAPASRLWEEPQSPVPIQQPAPIQHPNPVYQTEGSKKDMPYEISVDQNTHETTNPKKSIKSWFLFQYERIDIPKAFLIGLLGVLLLFPWLVSFWLDNIEQLFNGDFIKDLGIIFGPLFYYIPLRYTLITPWRLYKVWKEGSVPGANSAKSAKSAAGRARIHILVLLIWNFLNLTFFLVDSLKNEFRLSIEGIIYFALWLGLNCCEFFHWCWHDNRSRWR